VDQVRRRRGDGAELFYVNVRPTIVWLAAIAVSACGGDRVRLSDGPATIGPDARVLTARAPLPVHGPRSELTIRLPTGFHQERDSAGHAAAYSPDRQRITFYVALTFADGTQRALRPNGFVHGGDGFAVQFNEEVPASPGATARGVMVSANVPVQTRRIDWWTGDPRARCFLCL
jgi:hypothetical protein